MTTKIRALGPTVSVESVILRRVFYLTTVKTKNKQLRATIYKIEPYVKTRAHASKQF